MSAIGDAEKRTQRRVAKLFVDELDYDHLGDLSDADNRNIIEAQLEHFLWSYQGYSDREDGEDLVRRAIAEVVKVAGNTSLSLYDRNRSVYELLRYGVKVKADVGAQTETVWLIDWEHPERNRFAIAEEVTVKAADAKASNQAARHRAVRQRHRAGRPRAEAVERVGVRGHPAEPRQPEEGVHPAVLLDHAVRHGRQRHRGAALRHDPDAREVLPDLEGSRPAGDNPLDKALRQLCAKARFLELIHDFVVFDAGTKKLCRHNQYFGVRAAQGHVRRREGGVLWHTQGSGKSLTMVWLAKWIRENTKDARVLIITDRTELDEQIEKVFKGVAEDIYRTKSGADLIAMLNAAAPWLLCSLIHKFGGKEDGESVGDIKRFVEELKKSLPKGFKPKGNLFVFVDECHRTQSGDLHQAMKAILPGAVFIGFTGTPLLKADKKKSIEIFGRYIHTYKFDEAVADGVVLDLRYEARDIDQSITSPTKIDQWFEAKTKGLTPIAKAQLKKRWGTMQTVLSSHSRLKAIEADILMDMAMKPTGS
jgi:type I restriction enzyme R subunit